MIEFLKDVYNNIKKASITKKTFLIIFLVIYLGLLASVIIKVDYVVTTPGAFNHTAQTTSEQKGNTAVVIETDNISGNIYTIGVYNHIRVTYFQYLISQLSDYIDIDKYNVSTDLTASEEVERGIILKKLSINNALIVAYEAANLKDNSITIEKEFEGVIVSAVLKSSKSNLLIGDMITKINGVKLDSYQHFIDLKNSASNENYFPITVIRNEKERVVNAKKVVAINKDNQVIKDENGNPIYTLYTEANPSFKIINSNPKFKISEKMESIGGSGGAMLTLAIYNSLLKEDVTKGKRIAGTGTINIEGKVGDIGGVSQKIVTAYLYGIDIFFVNPEDYPEALTMYESIKPSFKLIKVNTFTDIINALGGEE